MFGIGPVEMAVLAAMLFGGGAAASGVGVPLPPDAGLQSAAPPECVLYAAHFGLATPDAKSTNEVEKLLAESEIQDFSHELTRLAEEVVKKLPADEEPNRLMVATLPTIAKTLLSRPCMLYVASVDPNPIAPGGRGGLVVSAGDQAPALRKAIEAWEELYLTEAAIGQSVKESKIDGVDVRQLPTPPGVPPIVWGVDGGYVFLTVGKGEAEALLTRLHAQGPAPDWLKELSDQATIPRPADLVYVNLKEVMKLSQPFIQVAAVASPVDPMKIIDALGLKQLRYAAVAAGLDESTSVLKLVVGHDEGAGGLLTLVDAQPLTKADFAGVPKTADFAFVGRVDADAIYSRALALVKEIDDDATQQWSDFEDQFKEEIGLDLHDDLISALGDRWTVYNSPAEGGSLLTGLCASVTVRDRAKAEKGLERIAQAVAAMNQGRSRPLAVLLKTTVGEHTIHYVLVTGEEFVVSPAWCLTGDQLIVALSPQMVRVQLSRSADQGTLADLPDVARQLAKGDVTSLTYLDGRGTAAFFYSYAQYAVTYGAGALYKQTGIQADLSKFPSYAAISKHLRPSVAVIRRGKNTISSESYSVGPAMAPLAPMAGATVPLALFGMRAARMEAVAVQDNYSLRTLATAAVSYAADKNENMPRAIRDADGKPLLSWRVALLPQLGEVALYERFKLDEPWDSPHNKGLISEMPYSYHDSGIDVEVGSGLTVFQLPNGKGTLYEGNKTPTDAEIDALPIGRSQTVLFVAVTRERAVTWTKPDDVELTPDNLFERLQVRRNGEFSAAMNDGSVLSLPTTTERTLLLPMFFPRTVK